MKKKIGSEFIYVNSIGVLFCEYLIINDNHKNIYIGIEEIVSVKITRKREVLNDVILFILFFLSFSMLITVSCILNTINIILSVITIFFFIMLITIKKYNYYFVLKKEGEIMRIKVKDKNEARLLILEINRMIKQ